MGGKGEKLVLSLKCLLIKMELSRKVFSFQTQTLLFLLSYINIIVEGSNLK